MIILLSLSVLAEYYPKSPEPESCCILCPGATPDHPVIEVSSSLSIVEGQDKTIPVTLGNAMGKVDWSVSPSSTKVLFNQVSIDRTGGLNTTLRLDVSDTFSFRSTAGLLQKGSGMDWLIESLTLAAYNEDPPTFVGTVKKEVWGLSAMPYLAIVGGNKTIIQGKTVTFNHSARPVADVEGMPDYQCVPAIMSFFCNVYGSADRFEFEVNLAEGSRSFMKLLGVSMSNTSCTINVESIPKGLGCDTNSEGLVKTGYITITARSSRHTLRKIARFTVGYK